MKQIYVAQPSEDGGFEVARWNEIRQGYFPIESNYTEEVANQRA